MWVTAGICWGFASGRFSSPAVFSSADKFKKNQSNYFKILKKIQINLVVFLMWGVIDVKSHLYFEYTHEQQSKEQSLSLKANIFKFKLTA